MEEAPVENESTPKKRARVRSHSPQPLKANSPCRPSPRMKLRSAKKKNKTSGATIKAKQAVAKYKALAAQAKRKPDMSNMCFICFKSCSRFYVGVKPPHLAPQQQCVPNMSVVYQANSGKKIEKDEKKKLEKQLAELKKEMSEPKSKFRIDLETFVSRFAHFCG